MQEAGANKDQIEFWNGRSARRWVQFQERQDRMLHPLGCRALATGLPQSGERVLDVGCGCGDTTIDLARKVAPSGTAIGIDVSTMMLARARGRTAGTDLNISFIDDDAQTHGFADGSFDLVYSRFGMMFFAAPQEAFVNLRRALTVAGRLVFVCWRAREENPWMTIPVQAAAQYLPRPQSSPPRAPGPFAYADRGYLLETLQAAGFRDIDIEAHDELLQLGSELESAVDHSVRVGPMAQLVAEATAEIQDCVRADLQDVLTPYLTDAGVYVPSGTWIVSARA